MVEYNNPFDREYDQWVLITRLYIWLFFYIDINKRCFLIVVVISRLLGKQTWIFRFLLLATFLDDFIDGLVAFAFSDDFEFGF